MRQSPTLSIGGRDRVGHVQESPVSNAPIEDRPRSRYEGCLGLEHDVSLFRLWWECGRIVPLLLAIFDALVRQRTAL